MEMVLANLPGCIVYVDDILITGKDDEEHRESMFHGLTSLQEVGLKFNPEKFHLTMKEVSYIGHTISAARLFPAVNKVKSMA